MIAFPEGVRGMNKLIWERYQLQEFGHGFMRLALETDTPDRADRGRRLGGAGAGDREPRPLARLLGMPAFPITLTGRGSGRSASLPLPVKYRIYFGEPMHFDGNPSDEDEVDRREGRAGEGAHRHHARRRASPARRSLFW